MLLLPCLRLLWQQQTAAMFAQQCRMLVEQAEDVILRNAVVVNIRCSLPLHMLCSPNNCLLHADIAASSFSRARPS